MTARDDAGAIGAIVGYLLALLLAGRAARSADRRRWRDAHRDDDEEGGGSGA